MKNKDDDGQPCVCVVIQTDGGAEPTRTSDQEGKE